MVESPITWVLVGYVCGSVPFGLLIGRARGVDIRKHGSGNVGATNCGRVLGRPWGMLCFALDVLKGLVPVLASGLVLGYVQSTPGTAQSWRWLAVGAAAVIGHVFPVWLKFRGGKGVATSLGVLLGYWPVLTLPGVMALLTWLLVAWAFRYVSLASVAAAGSLPVYVVVASAVNGRLVERWPFVVVTALLAALVLARHRGNLLRLWLGVEPKIGPRDHPPTRT